MEIENKYQCLICGNEYKRKCDLSRHLTINKNCHMDVIDYTIRYVLGNNIPKCKCGCGHDVRVFGLMKYNAYLRGHSGGGLWQEKYSKGSPEYNAIIEKIRSHDSWNKGRTGVYTDDQIKNISDGIKEWRKNNKEEYDKQIVKMTETKRIQSATGILSKQHYVNNRSEEEIKNIYTKITKKTIQTKKHKKEIGIYPDPWNKNKSANIDDRIKRVSGENHYLRKYQISDNVKFKPGFNVNAISIIDDYGKEHGYDFRHALNHENGEFHIYDKENKRSYYADGYDATKNVWLEYDERRHYDNSGNLLLDDIVREENIKRILNCKIIRIKEKSRWDI